MSIKQARSWLANPTKGSITTNIVLPYVVVALLSLLQFFSPINSHIFTKPVIYEAVFNILVNVWLIVVILPKVRYILPTVYKIGMILIIPTVILNLAKIDLVLSTLNPHSFSESLTRIDAIYFAVTTLTTIGSGSIYPVSEHARVWVTIQVIINFLITGYVIVKMISSPRPSIVDELSKEELDKLVVESFTSKNK